MVDLDAKSMEIVREILREQVPDCEVRAFGSRVTGKAMRFSDLDLAVVGSDQLSPRRIEDLRDAFSLSDLLILVDVLDWNAISPEFREVIAKRYEVLQKPKEIESATR